MKRSTHLMLSAALACCAAAAQAGTIKAADLPRISNGGTGFIGVTESVGMKRPPVDVQWSASGTSAIPLRAGEATTVVNGRPNENPAPAAGDMAGDQLRGELRTMGGSRAGTMSDFPAGAHRGWGTPD